MVSVQLLVAVCLLARQAVRAAQICAATGDPAPSVITLIASKSSATDAWIVRPDCSVEAMPLTSNGGLDAGQYGIERVDSVPAGTTLITLRSNPLSRGADLSKASKLMQVSTSQFAGLLLPKSVTRLDFSDSQISSLNGFVAPDQLQYLSISNNPIQSFKGLKIPTTVTEVFFANNKLTAIDFDLPPQLKTLYVGGNPISSIQGIKLPDSLEKFDCGSCALTAVRGVKWPKSIQSMYFGGNPITNFEIRRSDLTKITALSTDTISQSKCADSTAEMVVSEGNRICVIEDERFEAIYVNGNGITPSAPTASQPTTSPGSTATTVKPASTTTSGDIGESSGAGSRTTEGGEPEASSGSTLASDSSSSKSSVGKPRPARNSSSGGAVDSWSGSQEEWTNGSSASGSKPRSQRKGGSGTSTSETSSNESSSKTALLLGVCSGCVLLILVIGIAVWVVRKRRAKRADNGSKYQYVDTPQASTSNATLPLSESLDLSNDVRNDKGLIPFHIERSDLQFGEKLKQSRSSVVYKAIFQDAPVAVKQLFPGVWDNKAEVDRFMDEIRTCSRLDHHKVVGFVGISWTGVRDLSVVMELMPLGDLNSVLQSQPQPPAAQDWSRPWTESRIKSKLSIAQDVAEAVVYLHSFNDPILHRNLKARNVLLDDQGNAKLSGFGISRQSSTDYTMTGEIGTAAWVAPEVLRGERYDEKADVYSLGVLLVELDRCQHPYAGDTNLQLRNGDQSRAERGPPAFHRLYSNTQIAVMVSSGKLCPSVSSRCPEVVAALATACLSLNATDRPTSMEISYRLRQARVALEQS